MKDIDYSTLTPGIRNTVKWLREQGFNTTDSGDGVTNIQAGMEGALDIAHVHIVLEDPTQLVPEARRLYYVLQRHGVNFDIDTSKYTSCADAPDLRDLGPRIEAFYDPYGDLSILSLFNVDDALLFKNS